MTEQSMVERGAKALFDRMQGQTVRSGPGSILTGRLEGEKWGDLDERDVKAFGEIMRAAIEAMREPTRSMVDKGGFVSADTEYSKYDTVGDSRAEECWKVMISEALSAQSKGAEG